MKESAEEDEERKRNLQQKKRAPGDPKETALFDDRGSDFSLAGRFWSFGSHICARCWTGSSWFTGSSISSRFGNIEDASAPGSIQTKPATEVKPFRLSPALNNVLRRLLKTSRNFPGSSLFQCPFSNRNKHWNTECSLTAY